MSGIRTMNFDAVAAAAPLDRQASIIRDGSGDLWEAQIPAFHPHWDTPPLPEAPKPKLVEDLTGRTMGRLTVIRYHRSHKTHGAQWLVRCSCGSYELRRSKVIKENTNADHCCWSCQAVVILRKRGAGISTTGSRKAEEARLDRLARGDAA